MRHSPWNAIFDAVYSSSSSFCCMFKKSSFYMVNYCLGQDFLGILYVELLPTAQRKLPSPVITLNILICKCYANIYADFFFNVKILPLHTIWSWINVYLKLFYSFLKVIPEERRILKIWMVFGCKMLHYKTLDELGRELTESEDLYSKNIQAAIGIYYMSRK